VLLEGGCGTQSAGGDGAIETGLPDTGEATVLRERAEMLDEWIDLIRMLWDGGASYHGRHYDYETDRLDLTRAANPVQTRIPIWGGRRVACHEVHAAGAALRRRDSAVRTGWLRADSGRRKGRPGVAWRARRCG